MIWYQNSQRSLDLVFHVSSKWKRKMVFKAALLDPAAAMIAPNPFLLIRCVLISQIDFACFWIHPYVLFWQTVKSNKAANSSEQQGEWLRCYSSVLSLNIPLNTPFLHLVSFLRRTVVLLSLVNSICRRIPQFLFLKDIHWNLCKISLQNCNFQVQVESNSFWMAYHSVLVLEMNGAPVALH